VTALSASPSAVAVAEVRDAGVALAVAAFLRESIPRGQGASRGRFQRPPPRTRASRSPCPSDVTRAAGALALGEVAGGSQSGAWLDSGRVSFAGNKNIPGRARTVSWVKKILVLRTME